MSKYTLTIEGDFEKGECWECPLAVNTYVIDGNYYPQCPLGKDEVTCPLEEATVAKNATTEEVKQGKDTNVPTKQGKWINRTNVVLYAVDMADCTNCGEEIAIIRHDSFCPNCGADMRGGK